MLPVDRVSRCIVSILAWLSNEPNLFSNKSCPIFHISNPNQPISFGQIIPELENWYQDNLALISRLRALANSNQEGIIDSPILPTSLESERGKLIELQYTDWLEANWGQPRMQLCCSPIFSILNILGPVPQSAESNFLGNNTHSPLRSHLPLAVLPIDTNYTIEMLHKLSERSPLVDSQGSTLLTGADVACIAPMLTDFFSKYSESIIRNKSLFSLES